ncbi:MAG: hypothetical protein A2Y71_03020 [Bacteroidetes bacterium RBG_13_42_15]|nr:MAG: hypothetical protein A2Y71_03020 [Bacteroidetes bacterium RBG_13_42_15]
MNEDLEKLIKEGQLIVMTSGQLAAFGRSIILVTLKEMGLKTDKLMSGRIYKAEVVPEVIPEREWQHAVRSGKLRVWKNDPLKRNSKIYARRSDFDKYIASKFNREV